MYRLGQFCLNSLINGICLYSPHDDVHMQKVLLKHPNSYIDATFHQGLHIIYCGIACS